MSSSGTSNEPILATLLDSDYTLRKAGKKGLAWVQFHLYRMWLRRKQVIARRATVLDGANAVYESNP
jgi:hypothetical protein